MVPFYTSVDYSEGIYDNDYAPLQDFGISRVEITYTEDSGDFVYRFYKIESVNGVYYSNTGKKIDPDLIANLAESFTNLYESGYVYRYKGFLDGLNPHFVVVVTLVDGKTIVLESYSSYHCFIPWNITHNDTTYTQYNGEIPSALLKILLKIDEAQWLPYDKEARYGCYTAVAPDYALSQKFPRTEYVPTPEEEHGKSHLLWQSIIPNSASGPPAYADGNIIVAERDQVMCIDAETGKMLWEIPFEKEGLLSVDTESVVVRDGIVYVGAPDSLVYSIDMKIGNVYWTYKTKANTQIPLNIVEDYLIALTGGITCLERETGELIWEIPDNTWDEQVYNDKLLFAGIGEDSKSYYALLDVGSGEILWKEDLFEIQHPVYHEGVLYFARPAENVFMYIDVAEPKELEEIWLYPYDVTDSLLYVKVFDDFVFLLFFDEEKELLGRVVVINTEKRDIWKYRYQGVTWKVDYSVDVNVYQDSIFVLRQGGYIEAFSITDEEKLWETELRGTEITSFEVYGNKAYVSANDGRIYCLDLETGDILWMAVVEYELRAFPEYVRIYVTIGDGFLFVVTEGGNLYAFSC